MRYKTLFFALLGTFFYKLAFAAEHDNLHYLNKHMIPGEIEISDQVSIPAVVGDLIQSPIIKMTINGQGPFYFMFDTGFSDTMISKKLADTLKLPIIKTRHVQNLTPNQVVDVFQNVHFVEKIQLGGLTIKNYGMVSSSNFEDEADKFEKLRIDGVISANMFYGLMTTIDYKNEQLHFQKGSLSKNDADVIPCFRFRGVPFVYGLIKFDKLKKQEKQRFLLDTGNATSIFVNMCAIPEMKNFRDQEKFFIFDVYGNSSASAMAKLYGSIELSKTVIIKSPYITFSSAHCEKEPDLGALGRKFFEDHIVTLDSQNNLIKIKTI